MVFGLIRTPNSKINPLPSPLNFKMIAKGWTDIITIRESDEVNYEFYFYVFLFKNKGNNT